MLEIVDVRLHPAGKLTVDYYVPFCFRLSDRVFPDPFLWYTGDLQSDMLELTIARETCVICEVTLTCFAGRLKTQIPEGYNNARIIQGVPAVDVRAFPVRANRDPFDFRLDTLKDSKEFSLSHCGNDFFLVLEGNLVPQSCIRNDRIGFFDANSRICGFGFYDLTAEEVELVTSRIKQRNQEREKRKGSG